MNRSVNPDYLGPDQSGVLAGSTPVVFRGQQPTARVVSVGINPSIREFHARNGVELDGDQRRFETLNSLGVESMNDVTEAMKAQFQQRFLDYFSGNPYMEWFAPMERIIQGVTGASFFAGTAYHLDLVHVATDPRWGQLGGRVQRDLLRRDRPSVIQQLHNPSLEVIYLNGRTVCNEVGRFIPLTQRMTQFWGRGPRRGFHRGWCGDAKVVGCSSNIQEERLKSADRAAFLEWIIDECRRDLDRLEEAT